MTTYCVVLSNGRYYKFRPKAFLMTTADNYRDFTRSLELTIETFVKEQVDDLDFQRYCGSEGARLCIGDIRIISISRMPREN